MADPTDDSRVINPSALPNETTIRFILLVVTLLVATASLGWLYAWAIADHSTVTHGSDVRVELTTMWILFALMSTAALIFLTHGIRLRRTRNSYKLIPENDPELPQAIERLAQTVVVKTPQIEISPYKGRDRPPKDAQVYGFPWRYTLRLDQALCTVRKFRPNIFEAVILHELSHIRNRDVSITYASRALFQAFVVVAVPIVVYRTGQAAFSVLEGARWTESVVWWLPAVVTFIPMLFLLSVEYASLLRAREFYADWGAALHGARQHLLTIFDDYRVRSQHHAAQAKTRWRLKGLVAFHPKVGARAKQLQTPLLFFESRWFELIILGLTGVCMREFASVLADVSFESSPVFALVGVSSLVMVLVALLAVVGYRVQVKAIVGHVRHESVVATVSDMGRYLFVLFGAIPLGFAVAPSSFYDSLSWEWLEGLPVLTFFFVGTCGSAIQVYLMTRFVLTHDLSTKRPRGTFILITGCFILVCVSLAGITRLLVSADALEETLQVLESLLDAPFTGAATELIGQALGLPASALALAWGIVIAAHWRPRPRLALLESNPTTVPFSSPWLYMASVKVGMPTADAYATANNHSASPLHREPAVDYEIADMADIFVPMRVTTAVNGAFIKKSFLARLFEYIGPIPWIFASGIVFLATICVPAIVGLGMRPSSIVVGEIEVSQSLADRGYTPRTFTHKVIEEISNIYENARTLKTRAELMLFTREIRVEIAGVRDLISSAVEYIRHIRGVEYVRVGGKLIDEEGSLKLFLYTDGHDDDAGLRPRGGLGIDRR